MRGCFCIGCRLSKSREVLPAYAGMFLKRSTPKALLTSSPRVCGDVSRPELFIYKSNAFSPRMRGCFRAKRVAVSLKLVLPAYAGMFPKGQEIANKIQGSPRVCGDVSKTVRNKEEKSLFSPRMRGCFRAKRVAVSLKLVLPAYAGMFPKGQEIANKIQGSPRVCGDVSKTVRNKEEKSLFSPRMRGCFLSCSQTNCQDHVLPAYAGMFPCDTKFTKNCFSSPRVCGDVSLTVVMLKL